MSNNPIEEDRLDNDPTDELPILLETAVLDPDDHRVATVVTVPGDEETGQHTVRFAALTTAADEAAAANLDALRSHLEERDAKIAMLETDIGRLSARWIDVERHLSEKDSSIVELETVVKELRAALAERGAAEQRLTTEIADRDTQFNRLLDDLGRLRREAAAAEAALAESRSVAEAARDEAAALRAAAAALPKPRSEAEELSRLREEHAALAHSIGNRQSLWQELEGRAAASARRVAELEVEVAQRSARQREAEGIGRAEAARATRLRTQLVERSRQVEALEREVRALRHTNAPRPEPSAEQSAELAAAQAAVATLERNLAGMAEELAAERDGRTRDAQEHAAALEAVRAATPASPPNPPPAPAVGASEVSAQLETELEHHRAQLAEHRASLRERDQQLAASTSELEQQRRQLVETRTQLEQKRSDAARLERALIEKDRALEARDERIATLQSELEERLGALQRLNAMDVSLQGLDSRMSERLKRVESPAPAAEITPSLVCLTSDQPQRYAINKKTMTIGRSSQCDIQILTHFVSREHARLTLARDGVVIEDLGSTNGVFVNSVRVERHELRHSDLVTVGETQFRFLETMAH
ncbi:MAG TPA: FHA domain-containing protein [Gammaproteobacteria bacterium]|nr:FHA domain-containing protein [Gammaproteobacteria bacterium]